MQKINHIFSLKQWEQVQDSLSDLTGMAVLMVDYRGVPVTKHSHCCEFCRKVRESPALKKYCEKCDSHGGAELSLIHIWKKKAVGIRQRAAPSQLWKSS